MPDRKDNLTLLVRPGESASFSRGMPMMQEVSDPGPGFPGLRRFFRPWRFMGKVLAVGVPLWVMAGLSAIGGYLAGFVATFAESLMPIAVAGMNTAWYLALLPIGILSLWAGIVGARDLLELGRHRRRARDYAEALERADAPDVLSPRDLQSSGIREGLRTLGSLEKLLASVDRERDGFSSLLRDSLYESKRLVHRSVLDLIETERRLADWSDRLGEASTYKAKLEARRDALAGSYAGILDRCLHATDRALARADEDPADLDRSVRELLDSCQRALNEVERDGPAIDEQELLMYAAKAREVEQAEAGDERIDEPRP